jgi:hypothetical protein
MTAVALAAASAVAFAKDDSTATGSSGAMTFANVNVVNAPVASNPATAAGTAGMRAQKDQDTGALRAPTAEEVAALDATAKPRVSAQVTIRTLPNGMTAAILNEDFMSYEVVHKDANGKLVEQCVTGASAANHALHTSVAAQEVQNDR